MTIGKLTWYPVDDNVVSRGGFAITDKMRNNKHEMSIFSISIVTIVLDENTEPRYSLSRKKNLRHVFDVIHKSSTSSSTQLGSLDQLANYIHTSCHSVYSDSSSHTPKSAESSEESEKKEESAETPCQSSPPLLTGKEVTIEKHFMCNSDEERDSWIRAIRLARYEFFEFFEFYEFYE